MFSINTQTKSRIFKFLQFEKFHFQDELVWTVGLQFVTGETKLHFQIYPAECD